MDYLSAEGLRLDGRRPHELRRIECSMGLLTQADGSAYLEQGNTKVLATVYGPHDVSQKFKVVHNKCVINCQVSAATFSSNERKGRPKGDRRSTEFSNAIKQTFEAAVLVELFPRSQIDIYVQILQSDGGYRSTCINAATLAFINAGIPMKDYVCACSASFVEEQSILDINQSEENCGGPDLTVATLPKSGKIVFLQMDSRLHSDNLKQIIDETVKGCRSIHVILDQKIKKHLDQVVSSFIT
ncbi:exosome complex component RRP41-like [Dysidea avara]|uniref:exosome complex component RRP41-like n=1 Tax=Dysidea avara TaxID=196820 RepID=UPI003316F12D